MSTLCLNGAHLIVKMPTGLYVCSQCGQAFHEHHTLVLQAGTGAQLQPATPPKP